MRNKINSQKDINGYLVKNKEITLDDVVNYLQCDITTAHAVILKLIKQEKIVYKDDGVFTINKEVELDLAQKQENENDEKDSLTSGLPVDDGKAILDELDRIFKKKPK